MQLNVQKNARLRVHRAYPAVATKQVDTWSKINSNFWSSILILTLNSVSQINSNFRSWTSIPTPDTRSPPHVYLQRKHQYTIKGGLGGTLQVGQPQRIWSCSRLLASVIIIFNPTLRYVLNIQNIVLWKLILGSMFLVLVPFDKYIQIFE